MIGLGFGWEEGGGGGGGMGSIGGEGSGGGSIIVVVVGGVGSGGRGGGGPPRRGERVGDLWVRVPYVRLQVSRLREGLGANVAVEGPKVVRFSRKRS